MTPRSFTLSLLVFAPLIGMLLVLLLPERRAKLARWVALFSSLVPLWIAVKLVRAFAPAHWSQPLGHGLQWVEHRVWVRALGIEYFLGVDGMSIAMVLLTALLVPIAIIASFGIEKQVRAFFALVLLLEVGMLGTFVAIDFFLFFVFWELMLLPMYFLVGVWGGPRREYAAIKFFLYTLLGSVLMLIAMVALYHASSATHLVDGTPTAHTFDLVKLAADPALASAAPIVGLDFRHLVFVLLFLAFAVKIPTVPLHTWLPDAHVEAPTGISVLLAGVLLKMGIYGLLRISLPILPTAVRWAAPAMAVLGVISIVYGALCAFSQRDLKKLVAYSSVSHMGYCLFGLASLTEIGMQGAMAQLFNHGTITAMLFLCVGVLYDRTHTREISAFGGVASRMPSYALFFGLAFMASLGLPGLSGFIGEVLVLLGSFPVDPVLTTIAITVVVLTAAYHLWALQRVLLGGWNTARWGAALPDLDRRELFTLVPLGAIVIAMGLHPAPLLRLSQEAVHNLVARVTSVAGG